MTTHTPSIDVSLDQPPLPNQHFSSWLRGQTTLFISQIVAILGIILFLAEEVYYVSHFGEHRELLEPLTIKLIVDIAHIIFIALFILVLIKLLDDNERGSYRVKLVYERVFKGRKDGEDTYKSSLEGSKEQLKRFKRHFLRFWIGMLLLYVFFACQHGYKLALKPTKQPDNKATLSLKLPDGQEASCKADINYNTTEKAETAGSTDEGENSNSEPLKFPEVWRQLLFPGIIFFFNNFTMLFVFLCFLVLYIPSNEMKERYYKYRKRSILIFLILTILFPALVPFKLGEYTAIEWDAYSALFDALSGVINAIVLALLIARLDSKLVGLPSWLISILYSYAAAQPLFMVFELNQSRVLEKISTSVLIFVFVSKIYFFLITIYALQTGKMLNYLVCFPILRKRANDHEKGICFFLIVIDAQQPGKKLNCLYYFPILPKPAEVDEPESTPLVQEGDATQTRHVSEEAESTEGRVMRFLARRDKYLYERLGNKGRRRIRKVRRWLSRRLRSVYPLKISELVGSITIGLFFIFLIVALLFQTSPLFRMADLRDPGGFAVKLREARSPLSKYLSLEFATERRRPLDDYDGCSPPSAKLKKALVDELNQALRDSCLFDEQRFEQVSLPEGVHRAIEQKPQGDALLRLNRWLLEEAYPNEIAKSPQDMAPSGGRDKHAIINWAVDIVQLVVVLLMIVALYLVGRDNRYGGNRALTIAANIFEYTLKPKYPPAEAKKQLKKFKEYFFYFWCVTFLLYVVLFFKHLGIIKGSCSDELGSIAFMGKILIFPFLEFLLGTLNLLFIFWCFVLLRSPAFDKRAVTRQKLLINYSSFVVVLLIAVFPLLLFPLGPNLKEPNLRDYATVFDGVTGTLSAVGLALLVARMDSKLFGLPSWSIGILFSYASIQPLFVAFALNDTVLKMVQTSVLVAALGLKICFFLIIVHSLQSGKALNYLVCFPFLKERVDSIFENQFEIKLARAEDNSFTFSILKKNQLQYSTTMRLKSREQCDKFVHYLRVQMKKRGAYLPPPKREDADLLPLQESGTYWVELRSDDGELICESIPLKSDEEARELIDESIHKIPYCKYNRI